MKYFLTFALALMMIGPVQAQAAQLPSVTLSLSDDFHHVGDVVPLTVRLNSDGLNLNALDLTFNYSKVGLEVMRVDKALTNFPLWPEEPLWDNTTGQLRLSAGRPNGLVAVGATVATIYVKLQASGLWQFRMMDVSRGFINDGQGSPTVLVSQPLDVPVVEFSPFDIQITSASHPSASTWYAKSNVDVAWTIDQGKKYSISFSQDSSVTPDNNPEDTTGVEHYPDVANGIWWFSIKSFDPSVGWSDITRRSFMVDTTAPAAFTIEQLPLATVGKQTVIAWATSDKDSGVAAYQLLVNGKSMGTVTSPLTVSNKWIGKTLTIRAVDGAGNMISASWHDSRTSFSWVFMGLIIVLIVAIGAVIYILIHQRQKRLS